MPKVDNLVRPLVFASSGGGGLIVAANTILEHYKTQYPLLNIRQHQAKLYADHGFSLLGTGIRIGINFMSLRIFGDLVRAINDWLGVNNLPHYQQFQDEINKLNQNEKSAEDTKGRERPYVDMLLDVYPAGYEICSIFNALQMHDSMKDIAATVKWQYFIDMYHYYGTKKTIFNMLKQAADEDRPYTELISTQPMSLKAMCEAVIEYNAYIVDVRNAELENINRTTQRLEKNITYFQQVIANEKTWWITKTWAHIRCFFDKNSLKFEQEKKTKHGGKILSPVSIKQYMPDLATPGASHFFNALNTFTEKQRKQMELHAIVALDNSLSTLQHQEQFKQIVHLTKDNNPMLRQAFKETEQLRSYLNTAIEHTLNVEGEPQSIIIPANAKIASIMLGSLAGNATLDYIKPLLNAGYDKIIFFRARNTKIDEAVNDPDQFTDEERARIVCLGMQSDKAIAPIMARSECVITRSGGASIAEHMAIPMLINKRILIHHSERTAQGALSTGLPWEDDNAKCLIEYIKKNRDANSQAIAKRTSPDPKQIAFDLDPANDGSAPSPSPKASSILATAARHVRTASHAAYNSLNIWGLFACRSDKEPTVKPIKSVNEGDIEDGIGLSRSSSMSSVAG